MSSTLVHQSLICDFSTCQLNSSDNSKILIWTPRILLHYFVCSLLLLCENVIITEKGFYLKLQSENWLKFNMWEEGGKLLPVTFNVRFKTRKEGGPSWKFDPTHFKNDKRFFFSWKFVFHFNVYFTFTSGNSISESAVEPLISPMLPTAAKTCKQEAAGQLAYQLMKMLLTNQIPPVECCGFKRHNNE